MPRIKIDEAAIRKFNALPRQPRAPSGLVGNHWHFDLRFIYLEPHAHVLFLVQPESAFIHSERLPLGIPDESTALLFFPESGAEAAPEVAKALVHAFLDSFGGPGSPRAFAPWTLSTYDRELATEVGKEFKHLGIREELCSIRATKAHQQTADKAFEGFWERLTQSIELPLRRAMHPPDNINFSILKPKPWGETKELDPMQKALKYAQTFHQVGLEARRLSNSQISSKMMEDTQAAMRHLESTSIEEIQKKADAGDTTAALDYAVR
jgi:hypothetical protein